MGLLDRLRDVVVDLSDLAATIRPPRCPIPWRPHALAPVFHGYRDLGTGGVLTQGVAARAFDEGLTVDFGAPVPMRVLFPSIGGTPQYNEILWPCGEYPLVVLAHGQCVGPGTTVDDQRTHWLAWARSRLAYQLARAGYVVVVPQLGGAPPGSDDDVTILRDVISWMRTQWTHANLLAPAPRMALIGHSRGGVHTARLAAEGGIEAYVGLSGDYQDWISSDANAPATMASIAVPKLFAFGSEERLIDRSWQPPAEGDERDAGQWDDLQRPKHQAVIDRMGHFTYLTAGAARCDRDRGPCAVAPAVMADVVTMFIGRYVRPPEVPASQGRVRATLVPPADWLDRLTVHQAFYSGNYLTGFPALGGSTGTGCRLTLTFDRRTGGSRIVRLP